MKHVFLSFYIVVGKFEVLKGRPGRHLTSLRICHNIQWTIQAWGCGWNIIVYSWLHKLSLL